MGTNATIARPAVVTDGAPAAWVGRSVHYDGYPTGVGLALWHAYRAVFGGDVVAMRHRLIDAESVGWSAIAGCDLSKPSSWGDSAYGRPEGDVIPPQSYSARGESPVPLVRSGEGFGSYLYILRDEELFARRSDVFNVSIPWDSTDAEALEALTWLEGRP